MSGTLSSRLLGLVRQTLFNRLFSTEITDAFNVAYRVPNLFRELLAEGALTSSIIPVYKGLPEPERRRFAGSFLGVLMGANLLVVGLGVLLAPWIVDLLVSGPAVNRELAVTLTRLVMPFLAGISFSALAMALLNAEERFSATAFSPLAFNVVSILGFLAFPGNAVALGIVTTLGGFAQLAVQLPSLRRYGLLPRLSLERHRGVPRALALMAPFAFTTSTRQFLNVVLTGLLTGFGAGAVTGFANAEAVFQLALGLFAVSPALASYPRLATHAAAADWPAFRATVASNLRLVAFFCAPVSALLVALAPSVVSALFDWGGLLEPEKYRFTVTALPPLALAVLPWGLSQYLVRTFYVRERAREAIAVSVAGFLVNTGLYVALAPLGFAALNAATALTGLGVVGIYAALLHRQVGLPLTELGGHLARVVGAAVLAGLVAALVAGLLPPERGALQSLARLAVAGGLGGAVYLGLAAVLRLPELAGLARRLRR